MVAEQSVLSEEQQPDRPASVSETKVLGIVQRLATGTSADPLDNLIHERMRLGIVSALVVNTSMSFTDMKNLLKTTDGNLSVHARKLEEAAYISCTKSFKGRIPRTEYRITEKGRKALEKYLNHMDALIQAMREG